MLKKNLIRSVCGGENRRFRGLFCEYYERSTSRCMLLREGKMPEFWEKCRASCFNMLYEAAKRYLGNFKKKYPNSPIDETEDVDFGRLIRQLQDTGLKQGFDLEAWRGYMNKSVYREIRRILRKRGLIPWQIRCGTCKFMPEKMPFICPKTGTARGRREEACKDYAHSVHNIISIDADPDIGTQEKNILMAEIAEQQGFSTPETLLEKKEEEQQLPLIRKVLIKRIKETQPGTKSRQTCERQYEIFVNLLNLFSKDIPVEKALKILADKYDVTVRTVHRDLADIREISEKKCPLKAD